MAALTKQERDALPADDFAVPSRRVLPMHDAKHAQMAYGALGSVSGLSDGEKTIAGRRILARAESFGIDTTDWASKLKSPALRLEAMALNISNDDNHPNKMPFSGVLTRIGEPSDFPPGGSDGKLVMLTHAAAEKALSSLLGMAVDYTPSFDGHDAQAKIGIITSAEIEGDALLIEGFVYAADFPEQAARIRADQGVLGFSFEAKEIYVRDPGADPLEIVECMFTGAAILRRDKAAYSTTSLAASAEDTDMTKEEMAALLGESLAAAMKPVSDRLAKLESGAEEAAAASKKQLEALEANKATMSKVEPFAASCEAAADGMEAAGIGADPARGHATVLRKMAGSMRAEAAVGKMPHIYRDHDSYYASREFVAPAKDDKTAAFDKKLAEMTAAAETATAAAVTKAVEDATKPLKEQLASMTTKVADVEAGARKNTAEPTRKTVNPQIAALLSRSGLSAAADGDAKLAMGDVDAALAKAGITDIAQRIAVKKTLETAGRL